MTVTVKTTAQDGTGSQWLGQLGEVQNWKHTSTFPGGPTSATFDFAAPFDLQHPALAPGRKIYAYAGTALVWPGRLEQPRRGQPWSCTCTGIAAVAKNYAASGSNIYALNALVDYGISVGLPWTRTASLTNPSGTAAQYSDTIDGALGALVTQGGYWNLTPAGVITTPSAAPSATPSLLVFASDVPGGRSFDAYGNVVIGTYLNSGAAGATAYVNTPTSSADITRWGRFDKRIDLTGLGAMTTAAAQGAVNAILARYAGGPAWTEPLTVADGQVFTPGGAAPDVATIAPGITVRVLAVNPDTFGTGQSLTDIAVGQVDYDDVARTVQLTPLVSARDDMPSLLAKSSR